jgi:uncharacterized membrane protein
LESVEQDKSLDTFCSRLYSLFSLVGFFAKIAFREQEVVKRKRMFKKIFYTLLDTLGISAGIYLSILGFWLATGRHVNKFTGAVTLIVGIGAFLIHFGHYFKLGYVKWFFGSEYFLNDKIKTSSKQ